MSPGSLRCFAAWTIAAGLILPAAHGGDSKPAAPPGLRTRGTPHAAGAAKEKTSLPAPVPAMVKFRFLDVAASRGIQPYVMAEGFGGGVAAADFDDDGDIDLFVPNGEGHADQLYRNRGDGYFDEVAGQVGLASLESHRTALWLDYDGDHRLDLMLAKDCADFGLDCSGPPLRLFRQSAAGTFQEVTAAAGLPDWDFWPGQQCGGMCAGDINNDGFLDVVTGLWGGRATLLLNRGDGGFNDISAASGLGQVVESHWQMTMYDFNGDGWTDIFSAIDFTENYLWINQRDGTFTDIAAAAGVDTTWNDMGVTLGDYDNDGDFDMYVTHISELDRHNVLFRNDSAGGVVSFTDQAEAAGVAYGGFGWGATFFDADNDGRLDLAETNGWYAGIGFADPSRFFLNIGGDPVVFADFSATVGFDDTHWGSAVIAFDSDRDGDLDLVQTCNPGPLRLLHNQLNAAPHPHRWLVIRPRMPGPNHWAIGAVVRVSSGPTTLMRVITAGTSHLGQEPAEAFFGVARNAVVDSVIIDWPGGGRTVLTGVPTNQLLTVTP